MNAERLLAHYERIADAALDVPASRKLCYTSPRDRRRPRGGERQRQIGQN